ncbi:MAG TPA: hypothetical protein VHD58_00800 [Mycobacteriales bacterium]|nr:hypothetical protein [Mycobacteriales bacterium]
MTSDPPGYAVAPEDEDRHDCDDEQLWNESWYADFVRSDGTLAGYVRLGYYPNLGTTWWHVAVVGPDRRPVVCQRTDLPVPAHGTGVCGPGVDGTLTTDEALRSFSVRAAMTGEQLHSATDVYDGTPGTAVDVGLDLTWTTDGVPFHYAVTPRYEIPCTVTGSVTVDGEVCHVDAPGQRDHSWGVRDWWSFGWCWSSGHLADGTHTHLTDVRIPGMELAPGYVQRGNDLRPVVRGWASEDLGSRGLPTAATVHHDDLAVTFEPIAFGPILLTAPDGRVGYFPRAAARLQTADGRAGVGWIEWNQPPVAS